MIKTHLIFGIVGLVLIAAIGSLIVIGNSKSADKTQAEEITTNDPKWGALAQALTKAGAKFYGAYWCSHCQDQKALFGNAAKDIPYVECAPDKNNPYQQSEACKAANIEGYPTWIFKDGTRIVSVMTFDELSKQIGWSYNPAPSAN